MARNPSSLALRTGDRSRLQAMLRDPTEPSGLAVRARIILLAADDVPNTDIARRVGVTRQTVVSWRERYERGGITALKYLRRPGRPPLHDDIAVVVATLRPPPPALGVTRWTSRLLAEELGLSFATVARLWRKWGLQPWQVDDFAFATDPELPTSVHDVVALYLDPTRRAVVVRLSDEVDPRDEPVDLQARLLPTLEAAIADSRGTGATGTARSAAAGAAGSAHLGAGGFLAHLRALARSYPRVPLHVVTDVCDPTTDAPLQSWLGRHRRCVLHRTATPQDWPTIAHILFGMATPLPASPTAETGSGTTPSLQLVRATSRFLDGWGPRSRPFHWIAAEHATGSVSAASK